MNFIILITYILDYTRPVLIIHLLKLANSNLIFEFIIFFILKTNYNIINLNDLNYMFFLL